MVRQLEHKAALKIINTLGDAEMLPAWFVVTRVSEKDGAVDRIALEPRVDGEETPYTVILDANGRWALMEEKK